MTSPAATVSPVVNCIVHVRVDRVPGRTGMVDDDGDAEGVEAVARTADHVTLPPAGARIGVPMGAQPTSRPRWR